MTKTLNITETSNSGFSVVLKQDVNTEYESVLFVEFFSTMRKAENCAKKLTKEFMKEEKLKSDSGYYKGNYVDGIWVWN